MRESEKETDKIKVGEAEMERIGKEEGTQLILNGPHII